MGWGQEIPTEMLGGDPYCQLIPSPHFIVTCHFLGLTRVVFPFTIGLPFTAGGGDGDGGGGSDGGTAKDIVAFLSTPGEFLA